ncbi:MAG: TrkH family potassium uptake protein [Spirochaetota bacterium]
MKLSSYIKPVDARAILYYLAGALGLFGGAMLVPLGVSLALGEYDHAVLLGLLAGGGLAVGFAGRALAARRLELQLPEALIVTAFVYLLFSLAGAVAFLPSGPYLHGLFEAMSGFTTTGLSMFDPDDLPLSLHFLRAYAQWLGGMGIVILSLAVLLGPGRAAFRLYSTEYGERNIVGSVAATAKIIIRIYVILTAAGFLCFLAAGMKPFDALIHIFTTVSTGGFSRHAASIGHYPSTAVSLTVVLFMLLGAGSFPLYHAAVTRGAGSFFGDPQVRVLGLLVALDALFFATRLGWEAGSITPGLFQAVSAVTTTGFSTLPSREFSDAGMFLTTVLMVAGGCTGSTAGGIKLFRVLILAGFVKAALFRPVLPAGAEIPLGAGGIRVTRNEAALAAAFFTLYLVIITVSTFALLWMEGTGFGETLFEVASAQGTVGLSSGITAPGLRTASKLVLIVNMWLGRLEIIPVLVALNPGVWARKLQAVRNQRRRKG